MFIVLITDDHKSKTKANATAITTASASNTTAGNKRARGDSSPPLPSPPLNSNSSPIIASQSEDSPAIEEGNEHIFSLFLSFGF